MDNARFDSLTRSLSVIGTRRGLLGFLVALPGMGGSTESAAAGDIADASGRRMRRKKRHKHGRGRRHHDRGRHRKPKPGCTPDSRARTCDDACGVINNNCQQNVDCGPCLCEPSCPSCQMCDEITGTCVPDPAQVGLECGAGQFCRDDGQCTCHGISCAACETCQEDGMCSAPCGREGCCAEGNCLAGNTIDACGIDGETCQMCAENELCWSGHCVCGDVCADGCQFRTLWEAMDAVEPGATLRLCAETYAGVSFNKDVILLGIGDGEDGTVIRGQRNGTVVGVAPKVTSVLQGLRITGGAATVATLNGGGIYNAGESLTLIDCTVTGNEAGNSGGGIYGGDVTLINSRVTNNHAGVQGGGIFGAHYSLQNCEVSGNTAGRRGGAIFAEGISELVDTEVTDNAVELGGGGGIFTWGILSLTNSLVADNRAGTQGGGINNNGGELTLEGSQVTDNEAQEGGGIYFKKYPQAGSVTLTESTVEDNEPDNCAGDPVAGCNG